jgi:hypothetical protein
MASAVRRIALSLGLAISGSLGGCVETGDFGRPRATVWTDLTEKTGAVAAVVRGEPVSGSMLTDNESELRDRAWRFLMPAHERAWFIRAFSELTRTRVLPASMHPENVATYHANLMAGEGRSPASRYRRLGEDAAADARLIPAFAAVAGRVIEADRVRLATLPHVRDLRVAEIRDAAARVAENRCLMVWVRHEAAVRLASYRYSLEHLVIEAPQTEAIGAERALTALGRQLQLLADLPVTGPAGICPEASEVVEASAASVAR